MNASIIHVSFRCSAQHRVPVIRLISARSSPKLMGRILFCYQIFSITEVLQGYLWLYRFSDRRRDTQQNLQIAFACSNYLLYSAEHPTFEYFATFVLLLNLRNLLIILLTRSLAHEVIAGNLSGALKIVPRDVYGPPTGGHRRIFRENAHPRACCSPR